jgi:Tat protein secretion system quality control protein TatD with DNase activity
MATNAIALRPSAPHVCHIISQESDLIVILKQLEPCTTSDTQDMLICVHGFEVSKSAIREISYSNIVAF